MALAKRGKYHFGNGQADIRTELARYSAREYPMDHAADAVCRCGGRVFRLLLDEGTAAVRRCDACGHDHPIGDSEDYLDEAELEECECPCGGSRFELTVGVALYGGSDAVRWVYLGCRCPACGLTACYGDWKNEHDDYREYLARA